MSKYIQWYNENSERAYPISAYSTRKDKDNQDIPTDLIVDLHLSVPATYADDHVYCSSIKFTQYVISVSFTTTTTGLLTCSFDRSTIEPYKAYNLSPIVSDVSGWIVFGSLASQAYNITLQFDDYTQSELEPKCIDFIEQLPVKEIIRLGDSDTIYASNIIRLRAQGNLIIKKHETLANVIVCELVNASGFLGPCNSSVDTNRKNVSLHTINKVPPDANGLITLDFTGE